MLRTQYFTVRDPLIFGRDGLLVKKYITLKKTAIALCLQSVIYGGAHAGTARDDIDYNIYRNFAENRGPFTPGATDVPIYLKNGMLLGTLDAAPMPDWSGLITLGFAQLISPQYIATANHNKGFRGVQFGYNNAVGEVLDNREYNYKKVAHNFRMQIDKYGNEYNGDFITPRLNKLVTEAIPIGMTPLPWSTFEDKSRFPVFYRAGAGTQNIQSADGSKTNLAGAYVWRTGGTINDGMTYEKNTFLGVGTNKNLFTDKHLPLPIYTEGGDSGSPLLGWDTVENKWVFVGELFGSSVSHSFWHQGTYDFYQQLIASNTDADVTNADSSADIQWNAASLDQGDQSWVWHGTDTTVADADYVSPGLSALNAGKDLTFNGVGGTLVLNQHVDMGAGVLTFDNNYTVKAATTQTWVGGGLIVNGGHEVLWQTNGLAGDSLHKLGTGTLHINGNGINAGELSVGEGTVLLDQQADAAGKVQAFQAVDIVSGRATLVLADSQQVNPDTIYFGFRGGRLDVNGNAIGFSHIHNVDNGAQLVNHNLTATSTVTVTAANALDVTLTAEGTARNQAVKYDFFKGKLGEDDASRNNGRLSFTFAPTTGDRLLELSGGGNLNGDINVSGGTLLLSGYADLNADNSLYAWQQKRYLLENVNVGPAAIFKLGNHASLVGSIHADADSVVTLGTVTTADTGDLRAYTSECLVADKVACTYGGAQQGDISTLMVGDVSLDDGSHLLIGRAQFAGGVEGADNSQVELTSQAQWQLQQNSRVGRLTLQPGAQLAFASHDQQFKHLTIHDAFTAGGTVALRTNLYDGTADGISANSKVSGDLLLAITDISAPQPATAKPVAYLPLLAMAIPDQPGFNVSLSNGYVDVGNYRYLLQNQTAGSPSWGLYNALLAAQPTEQQHWTSRSANAILSDNDTHFESLINDQAQLQGYLDRLSPANSGLWVDSKTTSNRFASEGVRPRSQQFTLQRVGGDRIVFLDDSSLLLGAALGRSSAEGKFDQGASNNGSATTASVYGKWLFPSRVFVTGSLGYSRYSNKLEVLDKTAIDRRAWISSLGLGYALDVAGFTAQPSVTAAVIYTPSVSYKVDGSAVEPASRMAQQYRAGLKLSKAFELADTPLTPWLEFGYSHTHRDAAQVAIGSGTFESFGREESAQLSAGMTVGLGRSVEVSAYGGYAQGSFVDAQGNAGLALKWLF